jgi:hypothetical protein
VPWFRGCNLFHDVSRSNINPGYPGAVTRSGALLLPDADQEDGVKPLLDLKLQDQEQAKWFAHFASPRVSGEGSVPVPASGRTPARRLHFMRNGFLLEVK